MFANNNLGVCNTGFPDVCDTPTPTPTPIPYPNIAVSTTHIPSQFTIFMGTGIGENLATQGTISNGDDAGVELGVASGTEIGPDRSILGSLKTFVGAIPGSRLTSVNIQNSTNSPGLSLTPAQFTTLLLG